jgi:hypothetical protein
MFIVHWEFGHKPQHKLPVYCQCPPNYQLCQCSPHKLQKKKKNVNVLPRSTIRLKLQNK